MSRKPLPIEQIAKLADDIRVISNYAENHGFDTSLVQATVTPGQSRVRGWDFPFIGLIAFVVLFLAALWVLTFYEPMTPKTTKFTFVLGLLFMLGATVAAHKKWENNIITAIVCGGLIVVLLVGAEIFTPREAVEHALQHMNQ